MTNMSQKGIELAEGKLNKICDLSRGKITGKNQT